jgi:hypothetical protein
MKLKFKQVTVKALHSTKKLDAHEALADRGIFLPEKDGVSLQVVASKTMNTGDASHIRIALGSIYSSIEGKHHASMTQCLWDMVNQTGNHRFYDDCKNYVVDMSDSGAYFLVSSRFDTPLSVKLNGECVRRFLWGYLTMLQSPTNDAVVEVELPDNGFYVYAYQGDMA